MSKTQININVRVVIDQLTGQVQQDKYYPEAVFPSCNFIKPQDTNNLYNIHVHIDE